MNEEQAQHYTESGQDPAAVMPLPGTNEAMRRAKALMAEEMDRRRN